MPKVGKVKWLDKEYDNRLKQMIEDEIVVHEYRYIKEHGNAADAASDTGSLGEFDWGDGEETTPVNTENMTPSAMQHIPQSASADCAASMLGEELAESLFPEQTEVEMREVSHPVVVEDDWMQDDLFQSNGDDPFRFDDDHGDPLCDDDLI